VALPSRLVNKRKQKHRRSRSPSRRRASDEGSYICPTCGESIVIPLDISGGDEQRYVEDCPVCCSPNVIHVEFFDEVEPPRVWGEAE
jgi:hypothetical protein